MRNLKNLVLIGGATAMMALTVVTGCKSEGGGGESSDRTEGRQIDDKKITSEVKEKLRTEPVYKFSGVDVKTFAGVVQLSGFVNTEDQKRRAAELAQRIEGVARVENSITLKPNAAELQPTGRTNQMQQPIQSNP